MGFGFLVIWIALTKQEAFFLDPSRFFRLVALFLIISCVCDFLDGYIARKLKVSSGLGVELDSLADLISFGIAPVVVFYVGFFDAKPSIFSFVACLGYLLAGAFRLARFNNSAHQKDAPSSHFQGLPITGASLMWIGFLLFLGLGMSDEFLLGHEAAFRRATIMIFASLGFLMVSHLPYRSLKTPLQKSVHFKRNLFLLGLFLILLAIRVGPEALLLAIPILYVFGTPAALIFKKIRSNKTDLKESGELKPKN